MSEYMPKVGDRVRATLGENVLVGVVEYDHPTVTGLRLPGSDSTTYLIAEAWRFEQLVELPTKKYALVAKKPFDTFTPYWLNSAGRWLDDSGNERTREEVLTALRDRGYFILFEGVDE